MELLNATKMIAGYTMGMKPDGRQLLVVVVKGTFMIPDRPDLEPQLAEKQTPLVMADTFSGEPGFSSTVYESEYPPFKPRCDVLLLGSAYAPGGNPVSRVTVSLQVGSLKKSFDVVGKRTWQPGLLGASATSSEPFTVMPISYEVAYGGVDRASANESQHRCYGANHVGVGYHPTALKAALQAKPLPNTEEIGRPITDPNGNYRPMAFGPLGRAWEPRVQYAGTYDEDWMTGKFPFLPDDFDDCYYQSAPEDQQMPYPQGGEEIELLNLTPNGRVRFRLPDLSVPVEFFPRGTEPQERKAALDTIILEPDKQCLSLCWRTSIPLRRNVFEIPMSIVGRMPRGWYRARMLGKTYYGNLRELVADRAS